MCVCVASNGRRHDKRAYPCLAYNYVGAIQPVNAAHLACEARGNNVSKLAESFPGKNHINCTIITGLQITNCSGKNANT